MTEPQLADIMTSETDESLMRENLLQCYGQKTLAFRVSKEHYLYLTEQIISLREHFKRLAAFRLESGGEISEAMVKRAAEAEFYFEFPSARVDPAYWDAELASEAGKIRLARAGAALEAASDQKGETP